MIAGSVPILVQDKLNAFLSKGYTARGLVEYLIRRGVKAVVVVFKDTVIPGNRLDAPFPEDFENFAKLMNSEGLPLYIQTSEIKILKIKFSRSSISAKFFR